MIVAKYDRAEERANMIARIQEKKETKLETEDKGAMSSCSFVRPLTTSSTGTSNSAITTTPSTSTTSASTTLLKDENDDDDKDDDDEVELTFRNCYDYSTLKLHESQLKDEPFPNGRSIFAVRTPLYLTLTFDRKIVLDRINFYLRAASSLHIWFEWTEKEDEVDSNGDRFSYRHFNFTKWHHLAETHSWGANRAFEIKLSKPIFARSLRMHFKPVADDVSYLPVSLFNLAFTMDFPRERLIGGSKSLLLKMTTTSNEGNNDNKADKGGDNENENENGGNEEDDNAPAFVY